MNYLAFAINDFERQTAKLGTFASVGRALEAMLRGVATSAVAHAESTMHEGFEWKLWARCMDSAYLFKVELSGEDNLFKANSF